MQNILYAFLNPPLIEGIESELFFINAIPQMGPSKKRGGSEGDGVCHKKGFAVPIALNSYKYFTCSQEETCTGSRFQLFFYC